MNTCSKINRGVLFAKLPTAWQILQHALEDYLVVVQRPELYRLDDSRWIDLDHQTGHVLCSFGGAVKAVSYQLGPQELAGNYNVNWSERYASKDEPFKGNFIGRRILALDCLSHGNVGEFIAFIGLCNTDLRKDYNAAAHRERVEMPCYIAQPDAFVAKIENVIWNLRFENF